MNSLRNESLKKDKFRGGGETRKKTGKKESKMVSKIDLEIHYLIMYSFLGFEREKKGERKFSNDKIEDFEI